MSEMYLTKCILTIGHFGPQNLKEMYEILKQKNHNILVQYNN